MDPIAVCNMALGRIGVSQFIQSLAERSTPAMACNNVFESVRDRVLQAYPWTFADQFEALADVGTPVNGYLYRYRYPMNCIKAHELSQDITPTWLRHSSCRIPFKVVADPANDAKAILCNLETAYLWYTARIENFNMWSPSAVSAIAWLLASEIAGPLSAKPEYVKIAGEAYALAIREAGADDMNDGVPGKVPESEFVTCRW